MVTTGIKPIRESGKNSSKVWKAFKIKRKGREEILKPGILGGGQISHVVSKSAEAESRWLMHLLSDGEGRRGHQATIQRGTGDTNIV